jgi:uracil-DNA glycosylase
VGSLTVRKSTVRETMPGAEPNDATPFLPGRRSSKALREAAGCRGCHLWRRATQTVFGEGRQASRPMLVCEQPATGRTFRRDLRIVAKVLAS